MSIAYNWPTTDTMFWRFTCFIVIPSFVLNEVYSQKIFFVTEPTDIIADNGDSVQFNCRVNIEPSLANLRISWFFQDNLLVEDDTRKIFPNGSLFLRHITTNKDSNSGRSDEGRYHCLAQFGRGGLQMMSRKARLQAAYIKPKFHDSSARTTTAYLGSLVQLYCFIDALPTAHITWYHNKTLITANKGAKYNIFSDQGVLEIPRLKAADAGDYQCIGSNIVDTVQSHIFTLLVKQLEFSQSQSHPIIVSPSPPPELSVLEGESLTLFCAATTSSPAAATVPDESPVISWLHNGKPLDFRESSSSSSSRYQKVGESNLRISGVQREDAGKFSCLAKNSFGSIESQPVTRLIVQSRPTFIKRPKDIEVGPVTDIHLDCQVSSTTIPPANVTWTRNGQSLLYDQYHLLVEGTTDLQVVSAIESDSGIYQCFAENAVGMEQAAARLIVRSPDAAMATTAKFSKDYPNDAAAPAADSSTADDDDEASFRPSGKAGALNSAPGPPRSLNVVVKGSDFFDIKWKSPLESGSAPIKDYAVKVIKIGSPKGMSPTIDDHVKGVFYRVRGLTPGTRYRIRVKARNKFGQSIKAASLSLSTLSADEVPGAPYNITYTASASTIALKWLTPVKTAGQIETYRVYNRWALLHKKGGFRELTRDTPDTYINLLDLQPYTTYEIGIRAANKAGFGPKSNALTIKTLSTRPSAAPSELKASPLSSTSVRLTWAHLPQSQRNGILTGYKIKYRASSGRDRSTKTVRTDAAVRSKDLTGLQRGTNYEVRMAAMNINGSGPSTHWITTYTYLRDLPENEKPSIVTGFEWRPINARQVMLTWNAPANSNEVRIRRYKLNYGIGASCCLEKIIDGRGTSIRVKNLLPATNYVFELQASNTKGHNTPVYISFDMPAEQGIGRPSPPMRLRSEVLSKSSIKVSWDDERTRPGPTRLYTVKYAATHVPLERRKEMYRNTSGLSVTLDGLAPNTFYDIRVKIVEKGRESEYSMEITNRTLPERPLAPSGLTIVKTGRGTDLRLSWQPPLLSSGHIQGYTIRYTSNLVVPADNWITDKVPGDTLSRIIRGLSPNTNYFFKIAATNKLADGAESNILAFRTPFANGGGGGELEAVADTSKPQGGGRSSVFKLKEPSAEEKKYIIEPSGSPPGVKDKSVDELGGGESEAREVTTNILWIVIACGACLVLVIFIVLVVIFCRRSPRRGGGASRTPTSPKYATPNRKPGSISGHSGKKGSNSLTSTTPLDLDHVTLRNGIKPQPPDLWIHGDKTAMELRRIEAAATASNSEGDPMLTGSSGRGGDADTSRSSFIGGISPANSYEEERRMLLKPTAIKPYYPNGPSPPPHSQAMGHHMPPPPPSVIVYPHHQIQPTHHPHPGGMPIVGVGGYPPVSHYNNCSEQPLINHVPPFMITGVNNRVAAIPPHAAAVASTAAAAAAAGANCLPLPNSVNTPKLLSQSQNNLRPTTAVVASSHRPTPTVTIGSHLPPKVHIGESTASATAAPKGSIPTHPVRPQQGIPSATSTPMKIPLIQPIKPRTPLAVSTPHAPAATPDNANNALPPESQPMLRSCSTEELACEMASLEGLMKDLNSLTQTNFEQQQQHLTLADAAGGGGGQGYTPGLLPS